MSVLEDTIYNVMFSDDVKATEGIAKAVDDFGQYVTKLVKSIPATAFKMEKLVQIVKADTTTVTEVKDETVTETTETATKAEETQETIEKVKETATTETTETVEKTEDPMLKMRDELLASITTSITTAIAPLTTEITQKLAAIETRVAAVEDVAKKAEEAVKGTVVLAATGDKENKIQKKEGEDGVFDTAFSFPGYEG
jgi:SMC interacting uncharacterized protein involved in chromosome segregation